MKQVAFLYIYTLTSGKKKRLFFFLFVGSASSSFLLFFFCCLGLWTEGRCFSLGYYKTIQQKKQITSPAVGTAFACVAAAEAEAEAAAAAASSTTAARQPTRRPKPSWQRRGDGGSTKKTPRPPAPRASCASSRG